MNKYKYLIMLTMLFLPVSNGWGRESSERRPNLSNADLSDSNLRYQDLRNVDLSNSNLRYPDLRKVDFSKVNLRYNHPQILADLLDNAHKSLLLEQVTLDGLLNYVKNKKNKEAKDQQFVGFLKYLKAENKRKIKKNRSSYIRLEGIVKRN